jgi:cyclohexyl-isocyanide hydratase
MSLGNSMQVENKQTEMPVTFSNKPRPELQTKHLTIGCLVFPRQDQIDFTGPFEVFSRIPNSTVHVIAKTKTPVRDVKGLILTPEMTIAEAPSLDVLLVPGGLGQEALMDDEEIHSFIKHQADSGRIVFSVCTGALLCGAAGILRERPATTHWAAWNLLHYYGAIPTKSRVVVDGNYISTSGVTAGLDGALVVVSLLRGDHIAEEIQLAIEYAPEPVFHSGTPDTASPEVLHAFWESYGNVKISRETNARRFATEFGIAAS